MIEDSWYGQNTEAYRNGQFFSATDIHGIDVFFTQFEVFINNGKVFFIHEIREEQDGKMVIFSQLIS